MKNKFSWDYKDMNQNEVTIHQINRYGEEMYPSKYRTISSNIMKELMRSFLDNEEASIPKCPGELVTDIMLKTGYYQQLKRYVDYEYERHNLITNELTYKDCMGISGTPLFCDPHWSNQHYGVEDGVMLDTIGIDFVKIYNCYVKYHDEYNEKDGFPKYLEFDKNGQEYKFRFVDGSDITIEDRAKFIEIMEKFYKYTKKKPSYTITNT